MGGLMKIELTDLRFFAYHGLYAEERKIGNAYEINLIISYAIKSEIITDIAETINYAAVYDLVKNEMINPADLLETVAMKIVKRIHDSFPQAKKIEIAVYKLHPPIEKFQGKVGVNYQREY